MIRGPTLVVNGRETIDLPGLPGSDLTLALVSFLLILSLGHTQVSEIQDTRYNSFELRTEMKMSSNNNKY